MRLLLPAFLYSALALPLANAVSRVDYGKDIKPILARHCYKCHGNADQKAELRLDTAKAILQGGRTGPVVVPGRSSESLLVKAVRGIAPDLKQMPRNAQPLPEPQIALLARWVDEGAKTPAVEPGDPSPALARHHWAFIPPRHPPEPTVSHQRFVRNPIDAFIAARLEQERIEPAPEADRITLIRRLSLDLIGLPPTTSEVNDFMADAQPDACEQLVDRLLASPHFGERWGRLWLDVARYADSNGYSIDAPRSIWKYRDWVIDALNANMPFDQFVTCQLAGDLLPQDPKHQNLDPIVATGFHRNTQINQEGGIDKEQFRVESIIDRVNTTGTAFLGLTVGCAQCHDHKFDPLTQREYYELFAFFNNADEPTLEMPTPQELAKREAHRGQVAKLEVELRIYAADLPAKLAAWEAKPGDLSRNSLKPEVRRILDLPADQRSDKDKKTLLEAFRNADLGYQALQARLTKLRKVAPPVTSTMVMRERTQPRESHFFIKGDFTRLGERVFPATPKVLHPISKRENPNRLDLAKWIADPANPLTARVTVNRIWQQYFGRGIVETENDFGTQGIPPTHPELLDWLATELMAQNWNLKAIHRLIVTSSTYRQSSRVRPELANVDPNNKLLARQSRLRLDAEIVRDTVLSAAGLLSDEIGGPGVFPPQPEGVMALGQVRREWQVSAGARRYRRGLYTFFYRATPHPALAVFDAPDAFSACTRRVRSNTPLQALTLLNDDTFFQCAQGLAQRVLKEVPAGDNARLNRAFRLCLARPPSPSEQQRLRALLDQELAALAAAPDEAPSLVSKDSPASPEAIQQAAWTTVARVLLNLDETITRE